VRTKRLSQLLRMNRTSFLNIVQANVGDGTIIMNNFLQVRVNSFNLLTVCTSARHRSIFLHMELSVALICISIRNFPWIINFKFYHNCNTGFQENQNLFQMLNIKSVIIFYIKHISLLSILCGAVFERTEGPSYGGSISGNNRYASSW
jgi:hypothetical protein